MAEFTFEDADRWLGGRMQFEMACPACSASRKAEHRKLACFGLRRTTADRIVYACMNCGLEGVVTAGYGARRYVAPPIPVERPEPAAKPTAPLAARMWAEAVRPEGTPVEAYWLLRKLPYPIPPSIRFHPHGGQGKPTLVHAAALPVLDGDRWSVGNVTGVHRTFIDLGHPKGRSGKQALGNIKGKPLCVRVVPESLTLVIGEGLEKTVVYADMHGNCDAWATAGSKFFPHLVEAVPRYVETVILLRDQNFPDRELLDLARPLAERGIEVLIEDEPIEVTHA